ncbi:hypothetical protein niasHT_028334 [Heterodera trifolii]|uniref:Globin family profile domain-containing protein n=1 Tax=Heterodera trifolii TaxID=157864 RepID=A0ABD2K9W3_9BILA
MGNACLIPDSKRGQQINSPPSNGFVAILRRPINTTMLIKRQLKNKRTLTKVLSKPRTETAIVLPERRKDTNFLSPKDRELIYLCWHNNIVTSRSDLFHKAMHFCINASPKMNEIIACGHYCYRDLTKWPKLNRICQAIFKFFDKLINEYKMDEDKMYDACVHLGEMHANYAQYGLKQHFMDLFQQQLLAIIARLEMDNKVETCIAFTHLITFVVDVMIQAYSKKTSQIRATTK